MIYTDDEEVKAIIEHEALSMGFNGFINEWGVPIDWDIRQRNKEWHETFFTRKAVYDHQAKGNCTFALLIIKEMEKRGWINKGDIILDPMCGIGSFNIVSAFAGYRSIGVELEETFVKDMLGYDEYTEGDGLFPFFKAHVEGTIERFHRLTEDIPSVERITIIQGDARELPDVLAGYHDWEWDWGDGELTIVCSPPYGNRMRDEGQRFGSKDGKVWKDVCSLEEYEKQYSQDPKNVGTAKINIVSSPPYSATTEVGGGIAKKKHINYHKGNLARNKLNVICSPPYGRTTEHDEEQIASMNKDGYNFHGHRPFKYGKNNIAILKESPYTAEMLKVYKAMYEVLNEGSHVALITRNFIQEFKVVELDQLTIDLMMEAGFCYVMTMRARLPELSLFKNINWEKFHKAKGLPKIDWEEVTFFKKV